MRYDRYGLRVPAVLASPYARRDCVLSEVFDHTSVLKLIEEKWDLRRSPGATRPRITGRRARPQCTARVPPGRRRCPSPA